MRCDDMMPTAKCGFGAIADLRVGNSEGGDMFSKRGTASAIAPLVVPSTTRKPASMSQATTLLLGLPINQPSCIATSLPSMV